MDSTELPHRHNTLHLASSPTPGKTLWCVPFLTNHYSPVRAGSTHYCRATEIEVSLTRAYKPRSLNKPLATSNTILMRRVKYFIAFILWNKSPLAKYSLIAIDYDKHGYWYRNTLITVVHLIVNFTRTSHWWFCLPYISADRSWGHFSSPVILRQYKEQEELTGSHLDCICAWNKKSCILTFSIKVWWFVLFPVYTYPSLDPNWANFWFSRTVPSPADQMRVLVQGENTSRARENLCTPLLSKTCYPGLLEAALLETKKLSESSASQSSGQWF